MSAYEGSASWQVRGTSPKEWQCGHKHRTETAALDCALVKVRQLIGRAIHGDPQVESRQAGWFIVAAREAKR